MSAHSKQCQDRLIVLLGPTAIGKTNFSLKIAESFPVEIISGDSMQVYKGMDIGTGKASVAERAQVPHHMIDIREPDQPFSVSEFKELAEELIHDINQRGKLPLIVGGTGLYIQAVCYDYEFSTASMDSTFRESLTTEAELRGSDKLHQRLQRVDPEAAARIHPNDLRRIIRALEVIHLTGEKYSVYQQAHQKVSPYSLTMIGLNMERSLLYQRIEKRIDLMLEQGWLEEVRQLRKKGYTNEVVAMQALGYKELLQYLEGDLSYDEAVWLIKRNTRRFAKRQLSWFRQMDEIHWVDLTEIRKENTYLQQLNGIIAGKFSNDEEYRC